MSDVEGLRTAIANAIDALSEVASIVEPPADPGRERRTVLVNVKIAEESAIALAKRAAEKGTHRSS